MTHDAFQAANLLGAVVDDRFEILEKLGEGGMGAVYKARQISVDRVVALKILLRDQRGDPISVERFRHEAYLASRLNHPNAIIIHDFGQSADGLLYIAMEFLEGETLKERVRRIGRLPLDSAMRIASQTLRVLAEAHRMGLIHRDVKPDNIFLTSVEGSTDFVKVLDFGIAKLTAVRDGLDGYQGGLTLKGKIYGTPNYMSPEQIRGKSLDHQSDLYSFGVVLYELLAGRLPFLAQTPVDVMMMHLRDPPPPLVDLRPEIGPELETVVFRALEKDRRLRYQNGDEFLEAVEGYKFSSGFYSVPARLVARTSSSGGFAPVADEDDDDDLDATMALDSAVLPDPGAGPGFFDEPSLAEDEAEEDDSDATLMGAMVDAPPADERTVMEFAEDDPDERTAFEPEPEAPSALGLGPLVFQPAETSNDVVAQADAELAPTPAPAPVAAPAPAPAPLPLALGPPSPLAKTPSIAPPSAGSSMDADFVDVSMFEVLEDSVLAGPAASSIDSGPLTAAEGMPLVLADVPVSAPFVQDEPTIMELDEIEEVEDSRLVPIPHYDDSLSGLSLSPGASRPPARPASPFANRPSGVVPPPGRRAPPGPPGPPRPPAVSARSAFGQHVGAAQATPAAPAPLVSSPHVPARRVAPAPMLQQPMAQSGPMQQPVAQAESFKVSTDPGRMPPKKAGSKKGLLIALVVLVVLLAAAAVVLFVVKPFGGGADPAPVAAGPSQLSFNSSPPGAEIFRNGRFVGETPISHELSAEGEAHQLQIATKTATFRVTVPAQPGDTWVHLVLPGKGKKALGHAVILTDPPGATVQLAGQSVGQTPLVLVGGVDQAFPVVVVSGEKSAEIEARTTGAGARVDVALE